MSNLKSPKAVLEVRAWKNDASFAIREHGVAEVLRRGAEARGKAREKNRSRSSEHAKK